MENYINNSKDGPDAQIGEFIEEVREAFAHLKMLIDRQEIKMSQAFKMLGLDHDGIEKKHSKSGKGNKSSFVLSDDLAFKINMIQTLRDVGRPMSFDDLHKIAVSNNLIPIQILNSKSFLLRRLDDAYGNSDVVKLRSSIQGKNYYYLPEWKMTENQALRIIDAI